MTWQMVYSGTPLQLTPLGPTILSIITMCPASGIFPLGVVLRYQASGYLFLAVHRIRPESLFLA